MKCISLYDFCFEKTCDIFVTPFFSLNHIFFDVNFFITLYFVSLFYLALLLPKINELLTYSFKKRVSASFCWSPLTVIVTAAGIPRETLQLINFWRRNTTVILYHLSNFAPLPSPLSFKRELWVKEFTRFSPQHDTTVCPSCIRGAKLNFMVQDTPPTSQWVKEKP